jgi:hypothetical protein
MRMAEELAGSERALREILTVIPVNIILLSEPLNAGKYTKNDFPGETRIKHTSCILKGIPYRCR